MSGVAHAGLAVYAVSVIFGTVPPTLLARADEVIE
jgi:hypothetical protein